MTNIVRHSVLALSLLAGAALIMAPASVAEAKSIQRDGNFGGTWEPIGPRDNRYVKRYHRSHGYYAPGFSYYYGPRYRYYGYYGAAYGYDSGPGFSITIR